MDIGVRVGAVPSVGFALASRAQPTGVCGVSLNGTCVVEICVPNSTNTTITPGVTTYGTSGGIAQPFCNAGPSKSFTFNASDTAIIDTGMVRPPTDDEGIKPTVGCGDPINISNGNVYRDETDATVNTGRIGPFAFERHYNSLNTILPTLGSNFGYGWQHDFQVIFEGTTQTLSDGMGRRIPFYTVSTGPGFNQTWIGPPGVTDSMFRVGGDAIQYYELRKRNGSKVFFNSFGQDSVTNDRNNNQILLHYTVVRLDSVTAPGGRKYKLTTTTGNRITELRNQAGTLLASYTYHASPDTFYLKKVTYGDNSWVEYSYDSTTTPYKLKKILTSDADSYFYQYDSKGRGTLSYRSLSADSLKISYRRGVATGVNGDSLFAVVSNSLGSTDTMLTFPNALATDRLLIKSKNIGCGCAETYTYDNEGNSNLIRRISPLGVRDTMVYDYLNRLIERTEAVGTAVARTRGFQYTSFDLVSRDSIKSVANPDSFLVKKFVYDGSGNNTMVIDSGWINSTTRFIDTTRFTYNAAGQVLTVDGPRTGINDLLRYTYNTTTGDLDSVIEYTGSDSLKTAYTSYDAFGNVLTVIAPNGDSTNYTYDERQRVKKIVRRKGTGSTVVDSTLYQYNFAGDIKQITLPLGNTVTNGYDLAGRLTSIVNGAGDSILYTYDLNSNRKSGRIRKGSTLLKTTFYSYDSLSRLTQVCVGDSSDTAKYDCTKFGYDAVGNRTVQVSGKGDSTFLRYDALNRMDMMRQKHDAIVDTTVYTYDLQDNLTSVRLYYAPDSTITTYKYTDRGHLIEENSSASGTTTYKYDQTGNLITKIPATGNVDSISYVYDALNRQTQIKLGGVSTYTFDYDASATNNRKGRLWRETGPNATRKFSYDYTGRVTAESVITAGRTYRMAYTWDGNGNQKTLTYPDGRIVTYTYDLANRVSRVVSTKNAINRVGFDSAYYLPFGADTVRKLGNGIRVRKYFDRRYFTDSIKTSTAGIFGRRYKYDHNGSIIQLLDVIDSTKSYHTITYDGLDRLKTAFGDYRTDDLTYSYHKIGNRLTKQKGASTTNYNYLNNRLRNTTGAEVVNYGYNANGSVIGDTLSGQTKVYTYDKLNRIVKITGISPTDTFAYDGENKRVYSNDNGTELVNLYDIYGNLISQYGVGSPFFATDYVWANGEPIMRIDTLELLGLGSLDEPPPSGPESRYWFHTDHLGTPYVLTDSLKTVQWWVNLDPFAETVSEFAGAIEDNSRFPGQRLDRGSGLNYNWHRYYQPKIGRYYQTDPLLNIGLMNRWSNSAMWLRGRSNSYTYVENNPANFIDPLGLLTEVMLWQGTHILSSRPKSAFGHVSVNINGTTYNFYPVERMETYSTNQWIQRNAYRNAVGLVLNISPQQEADLENYLKNYNKEYNRVSNNCTAPVASGLKNLGFNIETMVFPISLGRKLFELNLVKGINFYIRTDRGRAYPFGRGGPPSGGK